MRWENYRIIPVKRIKLPGDIAARMKQPHVKELAESIRHLGSDPIHAPSIDGHTMKLIAGRDRMAAILLLGGKNRGVWCHVAGEVTAQDALDLEIEENLHRRQDNRDELIARRVAKVAGQLPVKMTENSTGRPKGAKGAAREQVARELGTTPEAVRSAERRAHGGTGGQEVGGAPPVELAPPVNTWDVPVDHLAQEFSEVRLAQEALRAADRHLQAAQRALSALSEGGVIVTTLYGRVYTVVHTAADAVRRAFPEVLCPYCKGTHRRARCTGCGGLGYVGRSDLEGIAPELTRAGPEAVVIDGKGGFEPIASALAGRGPSKTLQKTAAKAKALQVEIVDADGNSTPVAPPDDEDCLF